MTPQEQCSANLRALALAQRLVAEKREPTPGERGALLAYTGFGSTEVRRHAMAADGSPLPALAALGLSAAALDSLRRSVLTSFYTPPDLCSAIWAALAHLGLGELRSPRVLEPSAGTGRFLDAASWGAPDADASGLDPRRVLAVEMDECAALVLRALHPAVDARCSPFEALDLPPAFDVVVGNVPFGSFRVADPRFPVRLCQPVHDYFVCRSVSLLRPGGVAALVTAKSTLDRLDSTTRRWLAERADLLAAYRLPQGAFGTTSACADVLFLQRLGPWSEGAVAAQDGNGAVGAGGGVGWRRQWSAVEYTAADWTGLGDLDFAGPSGFPARDRVSHYFLDHPDHVFGAWAQDRLSRDRPDAAVDARPGDPAPAEALRALVGRLPAGALLRDAGGEGRRAGGEDPALLRGGVGHSVDGLGDWRPADAQGFALVRLLRAVRRLCAAGAEGGEAARRALSLAYDAYRARYGRVRSASEKRHPLHAATRERWWPLVAALEERDGAKSAVFRAERSRGGSVGKPENAVDAFYRVLDARGAVRDLQEVADLLTAT